MDVFLTFWVEVSGAYVYSMEVPTLNRLRPFPESWPPQFVCHQMDDAVLCLDLAADAEERGGLCDQSILVEDRPPEHHVDEAGQDSERYSALSIEAL